MAQGVCGFIAGLTAVAVAGSAVAGGPRTSRVNVSSTEDQAGGAEHHAAREWVALTVVGGNEVVAGCVGL
jgi:hypothetical protein